MITTFSTSDVTAPSGAREGTVSGNVVTMKMNRGYMFTRYPEYGQVMNGVDTIQFYVADYFDAVDVPCEVYVDNNGNARVVVETGE